MLTTTETATTILGNDTTGPFDYDFYIMAESDLVLVKTTSTGSQTTLVLNVDYTVADAGNPAGGTVTLTSALATGETLSITRTLAYTQPTLLRNQAQLYPANIESSLDRIVMLVQQVKAEVAAVVGGDIDWTGRPPRFTTATLPAASAAYCGQMARLKDPNQPEITLICLEGKTASTYSWQEVAMGGVA